MVTLRNISKTDNETHSLIYFNVPKVALIYLKCPDIDFLPKTILSSLLNLEPLN